MERTMFLLFVCSVVGCFVFGVGGREIGRFLGSFALCRVVVLSGGRF